ncbi:EI24 domain-containing protein, partial [Desulfococcaceae bacterium HSG8]|nr:EI24 domain-containing protein [Desulfococcaceae bacterium HSG8]
AILEHRLWPYMIIPGIMSFCYIILLIAVGRIYFPVFSGIINENLIPNFIKGEATAIITAVLLWLFLFFVGYITYKQVVLIILSPVLSYLSEVTEKVVYNGESPDFSFKNLFKDIVRGLIISLRNLLRLIVLSAMAWMIVFIPIIGAVISPILIFLIQFFYDGFSLIDYTLERKRYSVRESIRFAKDNRARVMGVGMGFMLILIIPLIGWLTAPAYGTVAATLASLEKIDSNQ